jgi:Rieske 2Fe-2S family protein
MSIVEDARQAEYVMESSLTGAEYSDPEVFHQETGRIFRRRWFSIGRDETIPAPGDYLVRDVAGDSIIVMRQPGGGLRGFFNTCRHRGSRLLEESGHVDKVVKCPYHSWTYGLDGGLVATPNVKSGEMFDRADFPLWGVRVDSWGGFIFVNMSDDPLPLEQQLAAEPDEPLTFGRWRMEELRLGDVREYDVRANWKIVVDNYNECLHCPTVHPELSALVPAFKRGEVEDEPDSPGNRLIAGATSFTMSGRSSLPPLPGVTDEDRHIYRGSYFLPNLMLNFTSDAIRYFLLFPIAADRTTVVLGHLFAEETVAGGADLGEVVRFGDLVATQDWRVCESAQRGVSSMPFAAGGGVYPYQDRLLADFKKRYRAMMGTGS